jgi:hypothetical protein
MNAHLHRILFAARATHDINLNSYALPVWRGDENIP